MHKDQEIDLALVERCKAGDRKAFESLVVRYQRPIYNAAYRVSGNADDASDIAQIVFLKVSEHLHEYDRRYKFFSWIYRIAVNEAINLLQRRRPEEALDEDSGLEAPEDTGPEWRYRQRQTAMQVQRALMGMKTDDRVVLTLRHFSECSYQEIAQILALEEKTVKSRLFEARQRLAALLPGLRPG